MLRHRRRWAWAAAALLAGCLAAAVAARGRSVPVVVAKRGALAQKVVMTGRVRAPARIHAGSLLAGRVTRVAADEGQAVAAGELLVELDDRELRATADRARAGAEAARARLGRQRQVGAKVSAEALRQAHVSLEQAAREAARMEALGVSGAVTRKEVEDARSAAALARSRVASAQAEMEGSAPSGTEAREALAALAEAEAALAEAESRLDQARILAPAGAVVLERHVEPGDVVQAGKELFVLARTGKAQLEAQPDEKSLAFLRPDQQGMASADAFAKERFPVRVAWIAPSVDVERGTVEVRLDVPSPPAYLKPDMTVSIEVEVARKDQTLVLPAEGIRDPLSPRPWALIVRHGRAQRQDVALGLSGEGDVEVLRGLSEGDLVIPVTAAAVHEGQRVRARTGG